MAKERASFSADEVIDLRDLVAAVWWAKWIIVTMGVIGGAYGLYQLQQHEPTYTAELIMAPKDAATAQINTGLTQLATAIGVETATAKNPTFDRLKILLGSV